MKGASTQWRRKPVPGKTACQHFKLPEWDLRRAGAFDVPLDGDEAPVYLDPRLIRRTDVSEFHGAMQEVGRYFGQILVDLEEAENSRGKRREMLVASAKRRLLFPEMAGLRIGYAHRGGQGRGVGPIRSKAIFNLSKSFVRDGFNDPVLFEVMTVVEEGVGADLISDMIAHIIRDRLYAFSERIARQFNLDGKETSRANLVVIALRGIPISMRP